MSDSEKMSLESNIKYLNMMFEVSTIANQTDDVYDLLNRLKKYCSDFINSDNVTFYMLENQRYKCISTSNENLRNSEFVEGNESDVNFWEAVNKAKLTSMKDGSGAHLFKTFLEKNKMDAGESEWFNNLKEIGTSLGFAGNNKEYKANKEAFKGHIGDVAQILRIALTTKTQTPNLFNILEILGQEKYESRINNMINILSK
jgi:glutamyl/glutaminyl-tRNA synthetase